MKRIAWIWLVLFGVAGIATAEPISEKDFNALKKRVDDLEKQVRYQKAHIKLLKTRVKKLQKQLAENGAAGDSASDTRLGREGPSTDPLQKPVALNFQNTPLSHVVKALRAKTDANIRLYEQDIPAGGTRISINFRGSVEKTLDKICSLSNMSWKREDKTVKIGKPARFGKPTEDRGGGSEMDRTTEKPDRGSSVGNRAPNFKLKTLGGTAVSPKSAKGRPLLLDFWATWCGPCRREIPNLKKVYKKYHRKGLLVLGVSLDRDEDELEDFIKKNKMPWPQVLLEGKTKEKMLGRYNVRGIPNMILIDGNGIIRGRGLRGQALETAIEKLFGKRSR
ncbi:MAG: redoxin domain-containing protein [Candidatus Brocadiia bacterium]